MTKDRHHVVGPLAALRAGPRTVASRIIALIVVLLFVALPTLGVSDFTIRIFTVAWIMAILTIGTDVSLGFAGVQNLAQASFFGISAYATAIALVRFQLPFELAIVAGVVAATLAGILIGLVAIRVRSDYVALVSLAFSVAVFETLQNWTEVTGGIDGYPVPAVKFLGIDLASQTAGYYACLVVLGLVLAGSWRFTHGFVGRALLAIRFDEAAATSLGISPRYFIILAVAFSAATAGLAGNALVVVSGVLAPSSFDLLASFSIVIFAIVGGSTRLVGGVVAAVILTFVIEQIRILSDYESLILGVCLLVAIAAQAGILSSLWARSRRSAGALVSRGRTQA